MLLQRDPAVLTPHSRHVLSGPASKKLLMSTKDTLSQLVEIFVDRDSQDSSSAMRSLLPNLLTA